MFPIALGRVVYGVLRSPAVQRTCFAGGLAGTSSSPRGQYQRHGIDLGVDRQVTKTFRCHTAPVTVHLYSVRSLFYSYLWIQETAQRRRERFRLPPES